ncbi:helix-turn-helix domain-containing protein [Pseudoroseicyclus aestuarii]|uniref:helix-turn-helix domain-containing protein n=1 Tax=Pseudoroseicyclus aestuarii TaxID=1795041 RepID=UPI0011B64CCA
MPAARPYTPETLAARWDVSATSIRNMCQRGDLSHFRIGKLYRIPATTVEEVECQTLVLGGSGEAFASTGARAEDDDVISLRHAPERRPSRRR